MTKSLLLWVDNTDVYREALDSAGLSPGLEIQAFRRDEVPPPAKLGEVELMLAWGAPPGFLAHMPRLKWIQTPNVGVNDWLQRMDLRADIALTCARGIHRVQMPENILGALFHITKHYWDYVQRQRDKRWGRHLSEPLAGKTLGILGLGTIGQELARKAAALEMRVIGTKRAPQPLAHVDRVYGPEGTEEMLAQADYALLLLSLTRETEGIMNAQRLRAMKPTAWLLNFARGSLVVDEDLIEAVKAKTIAGAVLDVFRKEPLPPEHPFWTTEGILVLPHIGGGHPRRDGIVAELFVENARRYLSGEALLSLVDRAKGY
jgi:glyoxylate/hydroxypyruvate reductase A